MQYTCENDGLGCELYFP